MCLSNLPIEFDAEGNPYIADRADVPERPPESGADGRNIPGVVLEDAEPEDLYADLLETLPSGVCERLDDEIEVPRGPSHTGTVEGD